jgi:hypothetical protein
MMARQVQSGLLQAALRAMRASRGTSSWGRKPDGHFQLLGAYGTFFDRQKLEIR